MSELYVHNPNPKKAYSPRRKNDFYPTPLGLAKATLERIRHDHFGPDLPDPQMILDPGAGTGVWGKAVRSLRGTKPFIEGVELDTNAPHDENYNVWSHANFLTEYESKPCWDMIIGNPPYSQAEAFIRKSLSLVNREKHWIIAFLLRLNFLAGQDRGKGLFKEFHPSDVYVCSRRPSFSGDGHTNASEYAIYVWADYVDTKETWLSWLSWDYEKEDRRK